MLGCRTFFLVSGLPSRLSAVGCPPLFEPFIGTIPESDPWPACLWVVWLSPSPTGLRTAPQKRNLVSRFSCMMFLDVRGVSDCAGSCRGIVIAPPPVWSSPFVIGSTPWSFSSFTAQYPACPCPGIRFTSSLSTGRAKLGVRMGHYSFPVRLFHSRHHAGLSRRTTNPFLSLIRTK